MLEDHHSNKRMPLGSDPQVLLSWQFCDGQLWNHHTICVLGKL